VVILRGVSGDRLETVRSVYEGWGKGDFTANSNLLDSDVLFVLPPGFPETGTYLGKEELAAYTRGFLEPWTHITIVAEELVPAGDSVFAAVLQSGTGDSSGAATELRYFQVWSFRGEKVIRLENFRDRGEALDAAGLA
jgi:ketosteroid isomerase-like protein